MCNRASTSSDVFKISKLMNYEGSCFQARCTMSPWSFMWTWDFCAWWYTNVLLAWPSGGRWKWMCTCDLDAFRASRSARLATGEGASKTRWRSWVVGVTRLNLCRSTRVFEGSISLVIIVAQESVYSCHQRFPWADFVLLRYTHSFFSASV